MRLQSFLSVWNKTEVDNKDRDAQLCISCVISSSCFLTQADLPSDVFWVQKMMAGCSLPSRLRVFHKASASLKLAQRNANKTLKIIGCRDTRFFKGALIKRSTLKTNSPYQSDVSEPFSLLFR